MTYRNLGRTGVEVSTFCLGCAPFGQATDEPTACDIVDRALDLGVNFLDTADAYGDGFAETELGKLFADKALRSKLSLIHISEPTRPY